MSLQTFVSIHVVDVEILHRISENLDILVASNGEVIRSLVFHGNSLKNC